MRFPYQANLGSTLRDFAGVQRHQSYARNMGNSSITKGEGSLDLLPTDDSTTPEASIGDLPDGSQGVGARIDGTMVNLATWSKSQVDGLSTRITTEKNRNDAQDSTLANHNTRISTAQTAANDAQSTANGAVTVNNTQNGRLDAHASRIGALENAVGNQVTQSQIDEIIQRLKTLYGYLGIAWESIGA